MKFIRNLSVRNKLLLVSLISLLLYLVFRSIVDALGVIKNAADRIAKGETELTVSVTSKDEIGDVAASFNKVIAVSKEYTQIAHTIGKGDYSPVINIRSDADLLGRSLESMRNNLQQLSLENEKRTWLLTGASELNDILRGEKEVQHLAGQVFADRRSCFEDIDKKEKIFMKTT